MNESKKISKIIWDFIKEVESDYGKYMSAADCDLLANKIIQAAGPREVSDLEEWALAVVETASNVEKTCNTIDMSQGSIATMWLQWAQIALSSFPKVNNRPQPPSNKADE